jgi:hypothetical protein
MHIDLRKQPQGLELQLPYQLQALLFYPRLSHALSDHYALSSPAIEGVGGHVGRLMA